MTAADTSSTTTLISTHGENAVSASERCRWLWVLLHPVAETLLVMTADVQ